MYTTFSTLYQNYRMEITLHVNINMPIYCTIFSHLVISVNRKDLVSAFSIINYCSAGLSDWKSQTMNVSIQRRNTAQVLWKYEPCYHPPFTHMYHLILSLTSSQGDLLGNDWIVLSPLLLGDFWPHKCIVVPNGNCAFGCIPW